MTTRESGPAGAEPQPWNPPEPRELPALREALADSMRSPYQHQATVYALSTGSGTLTGLTGDLQQDATTLLEQEHRRLSQAELYYVTADMTRLALVAAETLPVHSFHPEDVPAEHGFLVFAEPISAYYPDGAPEVESNVVTIVVVSWGPLSDAIPRRPGVWATFWSLTDYEADAQLLHEQGLPLSKARERVRSVRAELNWDNELGMGYGAEDVAIVDHHDSGSVVHAERINTDRGGWDQVKGTTVAWGQILRAAWLLITQPGVTEVEEQHLSRTMRRRAEREGYNPAAIRVVRIRHRENTPIQDETPGRVYHVRWTVRGHWRNQWYPSRGEHRPVWINPHIKGPDGAPLHTSQTVHVLDQ
jgi:hypothetical protein